MNDTREASGLLNILVPPVQAPLRTNAGFWVAVLCGMAILFSVLGVIGTLTNSSWARTLMSGWWLAILAVAMGAIVVGAVYSCASTIWEWFQPANRKLDRALLKVAEERIAREGVDPSAVPFSLKDYLLTGAQLNHESYHSMIFQRIADAGFQGGAARISRKAEHLSQPIEPFTVPFEPMLLDESAADLLDLAAVSKEPSSAAESPTTQSTETGRKIRRAWRLGAITIPSWFILYLLIQNGMTKGWFRGETLFWLAFYVPIVLFHLHSKALGTKLYIVPGGLIDAGQKRVYRCCDGVMIWRADAGRLHIADGQTGSHFSPNVTPAEAMIAMRAWLSQVPAPSDEMLACFLGKDGEESGDAD